MKLGDPGSRKEVIPLALLVASAVCAVLIMVKTTSFFAGTAKAQALVKRAAARNGSTDKEIKDVIAKSCAIADDLKKANLFSPPMPKQHPVTAVFGILGDEALIGSKWYKAGDSVRDARIVAVEATQVRIEWDGREKTFSPLQTMSRLDSNGSRRTSRSSRPVARANSPTRKPPQMVQIARSGTSPAGAGGGLTAEQREKSRQKAEKQRQAIEKKELQRASREAANKSRPEKKKKSPDELRRAKEKAAEKKARKLALK